MAPPPPPADVGGDVTGRSTGAVTSGGGGSTSSGGGGGGGPLSQWVCVLLGASSQFSASDNSAKQLLGAPRVFPKAGSCVRAWSAVPRPGQRLEWVRVGFHQFARCP